MDGLTQGGHTSLGVTESQQSVPLWLSASSQGLHFRAGGSLWDSRDGFFPCCRPVPPGHAALLQQGSAVCTATASLQLGDGRFLKLELLYLSRLSCNWWFNRGS